MREIKNFLVIPNPNGDLGRDHIEDLLNGKTRFGSLDAIVFLDPGAFFQVATIFVKERKKQVI